MSFQIYRIPRINFKKVNINEVIKKSLDFVKMT